MTLAAKHFPKKVRALTDWSQPASYPTGYAVAEDGRIMRLDKRTVDHLAQTGQRTNLRRQRTVDLLARIGRVGVPMLVFGGIGAAAFFGLPHAAPRSEDAGDFTSMIFAHLTHPALRLLVGLWVAALASSVWVASGPPSPAMYWPDRALLRRLADRSWVQAPPGDGAENKLAATAALLHDRITIAPVWKQIAGGQHAAPIDLDGEVLDVIRRLHQVAELRDDLGEPAGRKDPVRAQHEALDRAVLSIARRIEALADYADQLQVLDRETAELARLERAEQLQDKVLDIVSETAADPQRSVDSVEVSHRVRSVRAAIALTLDSLEASANALATKASVKGGAGQ